MRAESIFTGSVSWTTDENATKSLTIPRTAGTKDEHPNIVLSIKNASAAVQLTCQVSNLVPFDSTPEPALLVDSAALAIPAGTAKSKVITGFMPGLDGHLLFTKASPTAPAFTAYIVIRKA
jgi:hypothetical protein